MVAIRHFAVRAVFVVGVLVDRRLVLALATVPVPFEYLLRPTLVR